VAPLELPLKPLGLPQEVSRVGVASIRSRGCGCTGERTCRMGEEEPEETRDEETRKDGTETSSGPSFRDELARVDSNHHRRFQRPVSCH
jgi:hypothetical protein